MLLITVSCITSSSFCVTCKYLPLLLLEDSFKLMYCCTWSSTVSCWNLLFWYFDLKVFCIIHATCVLEVFYLRSSSPANRRSATQLKAWWHAYTLLTRSAQVRFHSKSPMFFVWSWSRLTHTRASYVITILSKMT